MINIIKNIIFNLCILVSFQSISYAMEDETTIQEKVLSTKAQTVKNFLDSFDIEPDKKNEIVEYFNQDQAGIPICINNSPNTLLSKIFLYCKDGLSQFSKELLLGSIKELYDSWYLDTLRKNNRYLCTNLECDHSECDIDKNATEIVNKLRHKIKIPEEVKIPILKRTFSSEDLSRKHYWHHCTRRASYDNGKLYVNIEMNSQINHDYPATIDFLACHELAHLEMGGWYPKKELLIAKSLLGVACLFSYPFFKDKSLWLLLNIEGLLLGQLFLKPYFRRREEKACDLRAIELTGSANGVEDVFSLKPTTIDKFRGANWIIQEIKIQKDDKPQEYFWGKELLSEYYSPANRVRYCQKYAKQLNKNNAQKK